MNLKKNWEKYSFFLRITSIIILLSLISVFFISKKTFFSIWFLLPTITLISFFITLEKLYNKNLKKDNIFGEAFFKTFKNCLSIFSLFFLVFFITKIIKQVTNDTYYVKVADLPVELIDKGYTKQNIIRLLNNQINDINDDSNFDNSKNTQPTENYGKFKVEAFGNSLYIDELIVFLRKILGYEKSILLHVNSDNGYLYSDIYIEDEQNNGNYGIYSRKFNVINQGLKNAFDKMIYRSTVDFFINVNPLKLVYHYYYKDNIKDLNYIFENYRTGSFTWLDKISYNEKVMCYTLYAEILGRKSVFFKSNEQFEAAKYFIEKFPNQVTEKTTNYFYLKWLDNLLKFGYAKKVIELFHNDNIQNKIKSKANLISIKGEAHYLLNEFKKSEEEFSKAYEIAQDNSLKLHILNRLAEIQLTHGNLEKALEFCEKSLKYDEIPLTLHSYEFCLNKLGKIDKLKELQNKLSDKFQKQGINFLQALYAILSKSDLLKANSNPIIYEMYPDSRNTLKNYLRYTPTLMDEYECLSEIQKNRITKYLEKNPNDLYIKITYALQVNGCNYNTDYLKLVEDLQKNNPKYNFELEKYFAYMYDLEDNPEIIKPIILNDSTVNSFKNPALKNLIIVINQYVDSSYSRETNFSSLNKLQKKSILNFKSLFNKIKIEETIKNKTTFDSEIIQQIIQNILNNPADKESWVIWAEYLEKIGHYNEALKKRNIANKIQQELKTYENQFNNN